MPSKSLHREYGSFHRLEKIPHLHLSGVIGARIRGFINFRLPEPLRLQKTEMIVAAIPLAPSMPWGWIDCGIASRMEFAEGRPAVRHRYLLKNAPAVSRRRIS